MNKIINLFGGIFSHNNAKSNNSTSINMIDYTKLDDNVIYNTNKSMGLYDKTVCKKKLLNNNNNFNYSSINVINIIDKRVDK